MDHDTTTPAPARTVADLGALSLAASCDHPLRIRFQAGDGTPLVAIAGTDYHLDLIAHRDGPGDPPRRPRVDLGGGWWLSPTDLAHALSHPDGVAATDDAQGTFRTHLPALGRWLATPAANDLVTEGAHRWRHACKAWAANTEADLDAARQRLRRTLARIVAGDLVSTADEHHLRHARVHPRSLDPTGAADNGAR